MACDEHAKTVSFLEEEDEHEDHHRFHHNLSRLSVCTNYGAEDDGDDGDNGDGDDDYDVSGVMSRLSMEETGEDADAEQSDSEKTAGKRRGAGGGERLLELVSSDSEKEPGCHSLPATPPRRRRRIFRRRGGGRAVDSPVSGGKAYASENEGGKGRRGNSRRRRRVKRELYPPWVGSMRSDHGGGESDHGGSGGCSGGGGGGVVVVTRPIGGGRPLCMDLEEVKACKELGFELEPGRVSYSAGSTLDTSSGGNSPISNWRISSPGDDPRDVKARLKAWAVGTGGGVCIDFTTRFFITLRFSPFFFPSFFSNAHIFYQEKRIMQLCMFYFVFWFALRFPIFSLFLGVA